MKITTGLAGILGAVLCFAPAVRAAAEQQWIEVQSPHFRVITDGTAGDARKVAFEFEQIRHVFVLRFKRESVGSGAPLTIFAARNAGTVQDVSPGVWKARGESMAGFFSRRWEEQFAVVRLDTWGDYNQVVAYHEYTHSILHANIHWLPVWLDEGMAEFYAYSEFQHDRTLIGAPSRRTRELHSSMLLPVSTMMEINQRSPYYRDEVKQQLFYAEAWGMVHYMTFGPGMGNGEKLSAFISKLQDSVPQEKAFEAVFGDTKTFDRMFSQYVSQMAFTAGVLPADQTLNTKNFPERKLSPGEADFEIARFQIGIREGKVGEATLQRALTEDPKLAGAHEELGYLDFDRGEDEAAKKEFETAVSLDPHKARSVFALLMMGKPIADQSPGELRGTQMSLQHVTELAPGFAPAYVELAKVEARTGLMQQAYKDARTAETLEPWRAGYHLLTARVLMMGHQPAVAANYARFVASHWYGPDHNEAVDIWKEVPAGQRGDGPPPTLDLPEGVTVARGVLSEVSCGTAPEARLKVTLQPDEPAGAKPLTFTSDGRLMLGFSDTFWWGEDHFNRCHHLSGHEGLVAYKPASGDGAGQLLEVDVHDDYPKPAASNEAATAEATEPPAKP